MTTTSHNTGPAIFFNAKQVQDAEIEAKDQIIYRHHSHALDRLKILDDQLLGFNAGTATQSAFYIVADVLNHVASCISDQDEHDRLRSALDTLQSRINLLNHGSELRPAICAGRAEEEVADLADLNHCIISEQCLQRLVYIFTMLRALIKNRAEPGEACQILEQINQDVISNDVQLNRSSDKLRSDVMK